jgi:hypothetical protein
VLNFTRVFGAVTLVFLLGKYIFYSDIAVISMASFLIALGPRIILKYYLVPYLVRGYFVAAQRCLTLETAVDDPLVT